MKAYSWPAVWGLQQPLRGNHGRMNACPRAAGMHPWSSSPGQKTQQPPARSTEHSPPQCIHVGWLPEEPSHLLCSMPSKPQSHPLTTCSTSSEPQGCLHRQRLGCQTMHTLQHHNANYQGMDKDAKHADTGSICNLPPPSRPDEFTALRTLDSAH